MSVTKMSLTETRCITCCGMEKEIWTSWKVRSQGKWRNPLKLFRRLFSMSKTKKVWFFSKTMLLAKGLRYWQQASEDRSTCFLQPIPGAYPIYYAAERGYIDCIKELISAGAAVDLPNVYDRDTGLMVACSKGHANIVKVRMLIWITWTEVKSGKSTGNEYNFVAWSKDLFPLNLGFDWSRKWCKQEEFLPTNTSSFRRSERKHWMHETTHRASDHMTIWFYFFAHLPPLAGKHRVIFIALRCQGGSWCERVRLLWSFAPHQSLWKWQRRHCQVVARSGSKSSTGKSITHTSTWRLCRRISFEPGREKTSLIWRNRSPFVSDGRIRSLTSVLGDGRSAGSGGTVPHWERCICQPDEFHRPVSIRDGREAGRSGSCEAARWSRLQRVSGEKRKTSWIPACTAVSFQEELGDMSRWSKVFLETKSLPTVLFCMQKYMEHGTAIHMCCISNSFECLRFLLESKFGSGFCLNECDEKGKLPLTLACERLCSENVLTLLKVSARDNCRHYFRVR